MHRIFQKSNLLYAALLVLVAIPLFVGLGSVTIRLWDESRLAVNAVEMYEGGNPWVTYFNGEPDMWNTKPPLMIWLQVASMKLWGINEWAIRFPSAVAALCTFILLFRFMQQRTGSLLWAALTVVVLVTTRGYIDLHVTRTGDYDALLILWTTIGSMSVWKYTETQSGRWLYVAAVAFGLAVLTKSIAGLLFLPAIAVYLLLSGQLKGLLSRRDTYLAILVFLLLALPYYFIREHYNPGYLAAVKENELGGRFLEAKEANEGHWSFYLSWLTGRDFLFWFAALPFGIGLGWKQRYSSNGRLVLFAATTGLGFLFLISLAKTKLGWYDAPIYPYLAIVSAFALYRAVQYLYANQNIRPVLRPSGLVFGIVLCLAAYGVMIKETFFPKRMHTEVNVQLLSNYIKTQQHKPGRVIIFDDGFNTPLRFYLYQAKARGLLVSPLDTDAERSGILIQRETDDGMITISDPEQMRLQQGRIWSISNEMHKKSGQ